MRLDEVPQADRSIKEIPLTAPNLLFATASRGAISAPVTRVRFVELHGGNEHHGCVMLIAFGISPTQCDTQKVPCGSYSGGCCVWLEEAKACVGTS